MPLYLFDFNDYNLFKDGVFTNSLEIIDNLEAHIIEYRNKPGQEKILEKYLESYIIMRKRLQFTHNRDKYAIITLDAKFGTIYKCYQELSEIQNRIIERDFKSYNKNQPQNKLTDYEIKFIESFQLNLDIIKTRKSPTMGYGRSELTLSEKKLIAKFYEDIIDNENFLKRINAILNSEDPIAKKYNLIISDLSKFSFKTLHVDKLMQSVSKLEEIYVKIEKDCNYIPSLTEQLTLSEYVKTEKLANLTILKDLREQDIIKHSGKLTNLYIVINRAKKIFNAIDSKIVAQLNYKSGDLIMDVASKFNILNPGRLSIKDWLFLKIKDFITKYSHAAVSLAIKDSSETKLQVSHVLSEYVVERYKPITVMGSETFRILPDKLISVKMKEELIKGLQLESEKELIEYLQELYQDYSNQLQQVELKLLDYEIINDADKMYEAGFADLLDDGHIDKSTEGIKKWAERVLEPKGDKDIFDKNSNHIICSEFAAKIIILALTRLNQHLNSKLNLAKENEIIKLPFDDNEKLGAIHPERLIKKLNEKNCIKQVEQPKIITQILR